ncbi:hypothetical protein WJX82_011328 [Trebouxia sp. C0006]
MAKRKRQGTEAQATSSDKARRFTDRLAKCLVSGAHGPIQEGKIGKALAAAVSQLPANRPERQLLQQHLAQYSQLLSAKLVDLQSAEEVVQPQLVKKHKTALPNKPEAQCLSVLCHRSCQTVQGKVLRCQQILAACVNVIPAGIVQQEPGLTLAASEVALLALEMRCVTANQSIEPVRQVLLAAHDIKSLTGSHSDTVLDMLLREKFPCVSSSSPEATCTLWEIMYKAALQVKPPGMLRRFKAQSIAADSAFACKQQGKIIVSTAAGWKADNAVNTVAEKTDRQGTDLLKSTRVQHSGYSDDDSSSDDE